MGTKSFTSKLREVVTQACYVRKHVRRGFWAQFRDLVTMYRDNPTCNVFDYYRYQLYGGQRGSPLYRELLGSGGQEAFSRSLNPRNAVSPAWDKMLFAVLCEAYDLPAPEMLAFYKPHGESPRFAKRTLSTLAQVKEYVLSSTGPIFIKPVKSHQGQGAFLITDVDADTESVVGVDGVAISYDAFLEKTFTLSGAHRYKPNAGFLFQRPVRQHPGITDFTQTERPSGLRILVLNTGNGPFVHRVIWKIIAPGNISDNFSRGKYGNMVSQVDPVNGTVSPAIDGFWPTGRLHANHPVSGRSFDGFTLPLWSQVVKDVLRASSVINDMGAMHWDVIISETGAVLLELNDIGGTEFLQLHGQGLIDDNLKAGLQRAAVLQKGSEFSRFIVGRA